jgi:hypothetical protein
MFFYNKHLRMCRAISNSDKKPKQSQFKPIQTQFNPIQTQFMPIYSELVEPIQTQ